MQYNYDENGAIFSYFLVTLLSLILIPTTIQILTTKRQEHSLTCGCEGCGRKSFLLTLRKKKKPNLKYFVLLFAWLIYSFTIYQSITLKLQEEILWDPYAILQVDANADERMIKKQFKKLSLIYHPDKIREENKAEYEGKFVDISKAYKVLTDEDARALFDEFGHPDGKQGIKPRNNNKRFN
jgi:translocation protein SEC63